MLDEFVKKHSNVLKPLNKWIERIESAHWVNHNDLKAVFTDADYITNSRYVYNIKGNKYRLIVVIVFLPASRTYALQVHISNTIKYMRKQSKE